MTMVQSMREIITLISTPLSDPNVMLMACIFITANRSRGGNWTTRPSSSCNSDVSYRLRGTNTYIE